MTSTNWLGFSLTPHDLTPTSNPHHQHHHHLNNQSDHHRLGYNSDGISGEDVSGECFDLMASHHHSTAAPFGFLEAFNRTNTHHHQSQDWNMKGLETDNNNEYKTNSSSSSDLSMIINHNHNSNNNHQNLENVTTHQNHQPKLENFLGRNSFSDHHHHHAAMFPTTCTLPAASIACENGTNTSATNIGLSMIKTWLRNQPETKLDADSSNGGAVSSGGGTAALSLSMSTGSQSSSALPVESSSSDNKQPPPGSAVATAVDSHGGVSGGIESVPRKSIDTFGQRTSIYRGVTRHRWTGRYEAHLWDNSCRREGQTRKGRQVYLGGYDKEEKAARAYDLAALKYWGTTTTTNFPISNYEKELEEMKHMTRQEYVASLRRKSSGFSRGASIYRGVTRHHQHGRWQARIGRVAGNKDLYLGTFSTQEEAAEAYDIAAIKFRGLNAVTNFDMNRYDVKSILESSTLPIGGAAKRLKDAEAAAHTEITIAGTADGDSNIASHLTDAINAAYGAGWPALSFNQALPSTAGFSMHYPNTYPRVWCKQEEQESSYHDLNNTHNFFQPNSVYHNLMGIDHHNNHQSSSSNIEHSSGSNSVMYSGDHSYAIPMATTVVANDHQQQVSSSTTFGGGGCGDHSTQDHVFGSASNSDMANYQRSLYNNYMTTQLGGGVVKPGGTLPYEVQGSGCNNWVPTAVPTTMIPGPRYGITPPFTVWNDA